MVCKPSTRRRVPEEFARDSGEVPGGLLELLDIPACTALLGGGGRFFRTLIVEDSAEGK